MCKFSRDDDDSGFCLCDLSLDPVLGVLVVEDTLPMAGQSGIGLAGVVKFGIEFPPWRAKVKARLRRSHNKKGEWGSQGL